MIQSAADLREPWPLKVVFDYVLGSNRPPGWMSPWLAGLDRITVLNVAAAAVVLIAIVGAVGTFTQKYLTTTVANHVGYDLRHLLDHHVQRLSLSFYEQPQTGDMVVRLTTDIDAAEDFISSAVLGIVLDG